MYDSETLTRLGFRTGTNSAHTSRTIMLDELGTLFECVPVDAPREVYLDAIRERNCLGKRSGKTRILTARHLIELYALDPEKPVHAGLRYFWERDRESRPLLALLAATARDSILREMLPTILKAEPGTVIRRAQMEAAIEQRWPDRFSAATLKSTAQNLNSSLTKSGHLRGRVDKIRQLANAGAGAAAFALYLGWLQGERGERLLHTAFCPVLDCPPERILELAAQAAARGWMILRRVDTIIEPGFPALEIPAETAEPKAARKREARK